MFTIDLAFLKMPFSFSALIQSAGWLFATFVGLVGLAYAMPAKKHFSMAIYAAVTLAMAGAQYFSAARAEKDGTDQAKNIMTLLAISGAPSAGNAKQGLDMLISRAFQPRQIIPTQEEALVGSIALIRDALPRNLLFGYTPGDNSMYGLSEPLQRVFARNGIGLRGLEQMPPSPTATGLMFLMSDPQHPPDYALQLKSAFELAGIRNIRFAKMVDLPGRENFMIFIGPPGLN